MNLTCVDTYINLSKGMGARIATMQVATDQSFSSFLFRNFTTALRILSNC